MCGDTKLLVVDDEAVICQACQRVFSRQGFQVDTSTNAQAGLAEAIAKDYSAILLDIKMPEMDGIQFLESLRKQKPDTPVMIMTGYPSIPNAASAVRLGASDYVTKPFTPEQITQSVRRMLSRDSNGDDQPQESSTAVETKPPRDEGFFFFDESWIQLEMDGSALVGALLRRPEKVVRQIHLPEEGETLHQGLPMAGVTFDDGSQRIVPSPISGVVVSVNSQLADDPGLLFKEPFGAGWIACVCSTRLEEESLLFTSRRVVLVNTDPTTAANQRERLAALGCRPAVVDDADALASLAGDPENGTFLFDADSLGSSGPDLVGKVHAGGKSAKVIVMAASDYRWETAYRDRGILYYAVEPFADDEIIEILDTAFQRQPQHARSAELHRRAPESMHAIQIVNRNGHNVRLLAGPGLLSRHQGLGAAIMEHVMEKYIPVKTRMRDIEITATVVLDAARMCDRVMVLHAKDLGRLPGTLVRDTKAEYVSASRENAGRATTLVVQPDREGHGFAGLDDRTIEALSRHIVSEMLSY